MTSSNAQQSKTFLGHVWYIRHKQTGNLFGKYMAPANPHNGHRDAGACKTTITWHNKRAWCGNNKVNREEYEAVNFFINASPTGRRESVNKT